MAVVGLNGSIWHSQVEMIDADRGACRAIAEKLVSGGFTFLISESSPAQPV